jgi:uncharacterized protein YbjT (DUF2867 family)
VKILVLGATGTVGSVVVRALLADGHQVRTLSRTGAATASTGPAMDVRTGDLTQPDTLGQAFEGIEGLFLLNAVSMSESQEGLTALEWGRRSGVRRIVYISVHHVEDAPHIPHFGAKIGIEAAVRKSGIEYTILRPSNFFQNDARLIAGVLQHGVYGQPIGDIGVNRVDVRDIAEVVRLAFAGRASNQTVTLAGPDVLTGSGTAEVYSRVVGSPVAYSGDLDAWERQARQFLPGWMVFDFRMMFGHFQQHGLLASAEELRALEQLLGRPPRPFEAYVQELVAASR